MKGYVYILQSIKNKRFYIGSTKNVENRLKQHQSGQVKATRNIRPLQIVFQQEYPNIKQARQIEYRIKRYKNRKIITQIIADGEIKMGP